LRGTEPHSMVCTNVIRPSLFIVRSVRQIAENQVFPMSWRSIGAWAFISAATLAGCVCLGFALRDFHAVSPVKFASYLILALLASCLKVRLPRIEGTLSVSFVFTLVCILELSLPETLILGLASTLGQFYWKPVRQLKPVQLVFNLSQVTLSSTLAYTTYARIFLHFRQVSQPLPLLAATVVYFACNSAAMSTIIALTENRSIYRIWVGSYLWSLPYYLVGGAAAAAISVLNRHVGWQSSLLVLPPIYLIYRSYRLYLGKLESEARMAEQTSNLYLRTIEALALAIEAKDETTGEHLQRVRVYATEVARDLKLSEQEMEALKAAAVLHDIGKLAVPEHIISKPARLTPEEFAKMQVHPIVGADILEQVHFPYPVVPIVRSHHEKWDGTGYPDGLSGEAIPIGARILAVVDCLDALASDRQYRKALPLQDAMAIVVAQSGISFDPQVVDVLQRRYVELENIARQQLLEIPAKLRSELKVKRGARPAAGFAEPDEEWRSRHSDDSRTRVSSAKKQCDEITQISQRFDGLLTIEDLGAMISLRLKHTLRYDAFALYCLNNDVLIPAFATGKDSEAFAELRIPLGEGLSGWVAQNRRLIMNGNPSVEPGYGNGSAHNLLSALVMPLELESRVGAVLALYRAEKDAFTVDDLRVLEAIRADLGSAVCGAQRPKAFEASSRA
jgi:putative nucleotidyltransferase with HDIG domain